LPSLLYFADLLGLFVREVVTRHELVDGSPIRMPSRHYRAKVKSSPVNTHDVMPKIGRRNRHHVALLRAHFLVRAGGRLQRIEGHCNHPCHKPTLAADRSIDGVDDRGSGRVADDLVAATAIFAM
jgi:hypothetical protein